MERKFKFVGDPIRYTGFKKEMVYLEDFKCDHDSLPVYICAQKYPEDWQEVTEPETNRIPNQDMPASSMTKFEMAVLGNVRGIVSTLVGVDAIYTERIAKDAIELAKETFKQLDKIK